MKSQTMKSRLARVGSIAAFGAVCCTLGGLGGFVALSYAAGQNLGGVNDYQIPYQGMLELSGEPVDGPTEFVFTLYKSKDSVAPADKLWTSNPRTLQVSRGYFATVLGDETDINKRLTPAVMAEKILYIGMTVDGVELAGRQRILAVPYAQNGAPGKNFVVDGRIQTIDLAVTNNATVTGKLNVQGTSSLSGGLVGGLNVTGTTNINGTTNISGSTNLNGGANISSLQVNGNITTGGNADGNKLVRFLKVEHHSTSPFPLSASTGMSANDWNCAIGGFNIVGDINEDGRHNPLLRVSTYISGGIWYAHVNIAHDQKTNSKGFDANVICFSTKISHRSSWL